MPDDGKVEFKAELDRSPLCEMKAAERKELEKHKVFSKEIKNIKFSEKVRLDPRKWKQKALDDGVYGAVRYLFQKFSVRVSTAMEDGNWSTSPKFLATFKKDQKELEKEVLDTLSTAVEELEKGTGEAKKLVGDLKKQIVELEDVDSKLVFGDPRKAARDAFKVLAAALKAEGKTGDAFDKAMASGSFAKPLQTAYDALDKANFTFLKNGKAAQTAIDGTLKMVANVKKDKEAPPPLVKFATEVLKTEREFLRFVDDTKTFETEMNAALAQVKGAKLKEGDAAQAVKKFESMNSLDAAADKVIDLAKKWKQQLGNILKDIK